MFKKLNTILLSSMLLYSSASYSRVNSKTLAPDRSEIAEIQKSYELLSKLSSSCFLSEYKNELQSIEKMISYNNGILNNLLEKGPRSVNYRPVGNQAFRDGFIESVSFLGSSSGAITLGVAAGSIPLTIAGMGILVGGGIGTIIQRSAQYYLSKEVSKKFAVFTRELDTEIHISNELLNASIDELRSLLEQQRRERMKARSKAIKYTRSVISKEDRRFLTRLGYRNKKATDAAESFDSFEKLNTLFMLKDYLVVGTLLASSCINNQVVSIETKANNINTSSRESEKSLTNSDKGQLINNSKVIKF
jgi:hypothetical protein